MRHNNDFKQLVKNPNNGISADVEKNSTYRVTSPAGDEFESVF